jgi:hypothetical protein
LEEEERKSDEERVVLSPIARLRLLLIGGIRRRRNADSH